MEAKPLGLSHVFDSGHLESHLSSLGTQGVRAARISLGANLTAAI
jgi:hypothetical protein